MSSIEISLSLSKSLGSPAPLTTEIDQQYFASLDIVVGDGFGGNAEAS